jgi:hypothetical protein
MHNAPAVPKHWSVLRGRARNTERPKKQTRHESDGEFASLGRLEDVVNVTSAVSD